MTVRDASPVHARTVTALQIAAIERQQHEEATVAAIAAAQLEESECAPRGPAHFLSLSLHALHVCILCGVAGAVTINRAARPACHAVRHH